MTQGAVHYYIGAGVFHFGGKDYGYGKALPADVPAATIEAMKRKGKVSETQPAKEGVAVDGVLGMLQDKVQQLTADLQEAKEDLEDARQGLGIVEEQRDRAQSQLATVQGELSTVTGELEAARNTVAERDKTIEDLTTQLMNPAVPVTPEVPAEASAGPKGGKK